MSLRPFKFANDVTNAGAIKQFSKPERQYVAYRTGKYLSNMVEGDPSTLTITPTATTFNVGTFVDTLYNPDVSSQFPRAYVRTYSGEASSSGNINKFDYINPVTLPSLVYTDDTVEITVTVDCTNTENRYEEIQSSISFDTLSSNYTIDSVVTSPVTTIVDGLSVSWENFGGGLQPQQYSVTYTLSFTDIGYIQTTISSAVLDSNNIEQPSATDIYSSFIRVERSDSPGLSEIQTSIYQEDMVTPLEDGDDKKYPVYYDVFRRGLKETNNVELDSMTQGFLTNMMEDELPGTYRLSADSPGDDWQVYLENVFIDTRYDGSSTSYSIWLRTDYDPSPTAAKPLWVRRASPNNRFDGLQEMNDAQIDFTFGERSKRIIMESGIGTYQLRSSDQGPPTDDGTWVARGVALDTRLTFRADEGYTGFVDYERNFDTTYIGDTIYEGDYEATYIVEYETDYESTYITAYEDIFQLKYTGDYVTDYEGLYETGYLNEYSVEYLNEYGSADFESFDGYVPDVELYQSEYDGVIDIEDYDADYDGSPAEYVATYNADYEGSYETVYVGGYDRDDFEFYSGVYIGDYLTEFEAYDGEYIGTFEITNYNTEFLTYEEFGGEYIGSYEGEYIGTFEITNYNTEFLTYEEFGGEYIGSYEGEYIGTFSTTNYNTEFLTYGVFGGEYIGDFDGAIYSTDFLTYEIFGGEYLGTDFEHFTISNYAGFETFSGEYIATDFEHFTLVEYSGFETFTGEYITTDFEHFSISNYSGFETFTGEYIATDFEHFSISNYTGFETFTGEYITTDFEHFSISNYTGFEAFTGEYITTDFEHFSISNYTGFETFTGEYGGFENYAGPSNVATLAFDPTTIQYSVANLNGGGTPVQNITLFRNGDATVVKSVIGGITTIDVTTPAIDSSGTNTNWSDQQGPNFGDNYQIQVNCYTDSSKTTRMPGNTTRNGYDTVFLYKGSTLLNGNPVGVSNVQWEQDDATPAWFQMNDDITISAAVSVQGVFPGGNKVISQPGYIEFIIKEYSGTLGTGTTVLTAGHDFFVSAKNY